MTGITFKRITPEESRIYADGMIIGEVYRQDDILKPGSHYYVVHLSEDYRGPAPCPRPQQDPRGDRAPREYPSAVGLTDVGQGGRSPRQCRVLGRCRGKEVWAMPSARALRSNLRSLRSLRFPLRSLSPPVAGKLACALRLPGNSGHGQCIHCRRKCLAEPSKGAVPCDQTNTPPT